MKLSDINASQFADALIDVSGNLTKQAEPHTSTFVIYMSAAQVLLGIAEAVIRAQKATVEDKLFDLKEKSDATAQHPV